MGSHHMQIGEVAEQTGLSLRTIRYYEEVGLVPPSARTSGGFRLYSESDVARLRLVRRMKPLDFSLDQMKDVLEALDTLEDPVRAEAEGEQMVARLETYRDSADERVETLRKHLETAEGFADDLRRELNRQRHLSGLES